MLSGGPPVVSDKYDNRPCYRITNILIFSEIYNQRKKIIQKKGAFQLPFPVVKKSPRLIKRQGELNNQY